VVAADEEAVREESAEGQRQKYTAQLNLTVRHRLDDGSSDEGDKH
jgi:hypothetical protein